MGFVRSTSKKKGYTFFDLMTISDIAYTVAVLENSHEVWDEEYKKKRMSGVEWAQYRTSDGYTSSKPKFTDRKGRKREYCDSGWSKEGTDFYNGVYQRWKVIAFKNNVRVWSSLEEEWAQLFPCIRMVTSNGCVISVNNMH